MINDERINVVETALKIDAVICGIDVMLLQFNEKTSFLKENMELLHEMWHFSPVSHMSYSVITAQDTESVYKFYNYDADIVAIERNDFFAVYQCVSDRFKRFCWILCKNLYFLVAKVKI